MKTKTESPELRRVREARERAEFHAAVSRGAPATTRAPAGPSPYVTYPLLSGRRWHPTQAEVRFLSREALDQEWSVVIRRAAAAEFPRQTVELRTAAFVAGHLVVGGRLTAPKAMEHLHAAANRAGVPADQAQRAIEGGYANGQTRASLELDCGGRLGLDDHPPGAFSAVAAVSTRYDHENNFFVDPAGLLPLPAAVLVHFDHDKSHDLTKAPVAVGVPSFRDGAVHVDAVFSSLTGDAWTLVRKGRLRSVSVLAAAAEFHRGAEGRLTRGTLVAVDLVRSPADKEAAIGKVVEGDKMTPGQRRTQELFDNYLYRPANQPTSPRGAALLEAAERRGVEAMDVLAPVVAPLREERAKRHLAEAGR